APQRPSFEASRSDPSVGNLLQFLGEILIFFAGGTAAAGDLDKLGLGEIDLAGGDIAFAQIFTDKNVIGIDGKRFLIVADALIDLARLAIAVPDIVENARIVLIGDRGENRQRPVIFAGLGE